MHAPSVQNSKMCIALKEQRTYFYTKSTSDSTLFCELSMIYSKHFEIYQKRSLKFSKSLINIVGAVFYMLRRDTVRSHELRLGSNNYTARPYSIARVYKLAVPQFSRDTIIIGWHPSTIEKLIWHLHAIWCTIVVQETIRWCEYKMKIFNFVLPNRISTSHHTSWSISISFAWKEIIASLSLKIMSIFFKIQIIHRCLYQVLCIWKVQILQDIANTGGLISQHERQLLDWCQSWSWCCVHSVRYL